MLSPNVESWGLQLTQIVGVVIIEILDNIRIMDSWKYIFEPISSSIVLVLY